MHLRVPLERPVKPNNYKKYICTSSSRSIEGKLLLGQYFESYIADIDHDMPVWCESQPQSLYCAYHQSLC